MESLVQDEFDRLGIADRVKRISAVNREDVKKKHGDLVTHLSNPKLGQTCSYRKFT